MVRKEINKYALIDVIEYELEWREKAHQIKLEEKNKILQEKNKEIKKRKKILQEKNKEIKKRKKILQEKNKEIQKQNKENARLKAILIENGIEF